MLEENIRTSLREERLFHPRREFVADSQIKSLDEYRELWSFSTENPDEFWGQQARTLLEWSRPFTKVLEWDCPKARWFGDGQLNASHNCVDRHTHSWRRNKAAIIWEGEPGETRVLTYADLARETAKLARALVDLGIGAGDVVTIYLPMVPEMAIAMLACARIGAVHNVVFGGFSSHALAERNNDSKAKLVITADGGWRRGQLIPYKSNVDAALSDSPSVKKVVVLRRTFQAVPMVLGRDHCWQEIVGNRPAFFEPRAVDAEHPLFVLYTSGSTGKPKGLVHTTAGYLLGTTLSTKLVFDLKDEDIFWCTADAGWVTGHSYVIYGPLSNGATLFMYEGALNYPDAGRIWRMIENHRINTLYTAPTAIRAFMKAGAQWPRASDLSSLRLLGTVGESINPEAWIWYHEHIGRGQCPIVDTWWQTETGSIMISPLPGAVPTKPGSATLPFLGVAPEIFDKNGNPLEGDQGGYLVLARPHPSMARTILGDDKRYFEQYWSRFPGHYLTGDGARRDSDGYYWILGRIDDVVNISGHRLSTMEVESALVSHPDVAEAAVVGVPHALKGEGIVAFVILRSGTHPAETLKGDLAEHVAEAIGSFARPEAVRFTDALPKTRSGKIMRRLLRDIAAGREHTGDTSTLEDFSVLAALKADEEA